MESGLIFNQLICEFESRHPCQITINFGGIASIRITIVRWPKQKHPTCLRQQWFTYASLLSIARCPSLDQTGGGNDEAGVVERTLADVPAREHR